MTYHKLLVLAILCKSFICLPEGDTKYDKADYHPTKSNLTFNENISEMYLYKNQVEGEEIVIEKIRKKLGLTKFQKKGKKFSANRIDFQQLIDFTYNR